MLVFVCISGGWKVVMLAKGGRSISCISSGGGGGGGGAAGDFVEAEMKQSFGVWFFTTFHRGMKKRGGMSDGPDWKYVVFER